MRTIMKVTLGLVALSLLCLAPMGRTQPGKEEAPKSDCGAPITLAELKTRLDGLGYEPKEVKNAKGELFGYDVQLTSGTWNFGARFSLSPNKAYVWVVTGLLTVKPEEIPTKSLMGLLVNNDYTLPVSYVTFYEPGNMFLLKSSTKNCGLNAKAIKDMIATHLVAFSSSEKYWNPKNWKK